ncbi:hypothetical protein L798_08912 [Zootermopsis nevadensis]|uniref:Uncharacterized protein n=1 Tax=Zootermopsis nevadensis TaxID=136037 RepID=A0A067RDP3_ZOONE|nr:hypothetical protein L798_08912 [Zootermopsis nevadensis]
MPLRAASKYERVRHWFFGDMKTQPGRAKCYWRNLTGKSSTRDCKGNTNWKEAISPRERLAVCIRYLATGDSLKSIEFNYHLGHAAVQKSVRETCRAIV